MDRDQTAPVKQSVLGPHYLSKKFQIFPRSTKQLSMLENCCQQIHLFLCFHVILQLYGKWQFVVFTRSLNLYTNLFKSVQKMCLLD